MMVDDERTMTLGVRLLRARLAHKANKDPRGSQVRVAQELGVNQSTVSLWERDASLPDIEYLPAIAEFLAVPLDDVVEQWKVQKAAKSSDVDRLVELASLIHQSDVLPLDPGDDRNVMEAVQTLLQTAEAQAEAAKQLMYALRRKR